MKKPVKVTVEWSNGFTHSYDFDYPTESRLEKLVEHYEELSHVVKVKFDRKVVKK
jgi:hypothetical protein